VKLLFLLLLIAPTFLLGGCKMGGGNASGISLSETARRATPTINALPEAGQRNDLTAALQTFTPASQNESTLKSLFAARRDVFDAFTPIPAEDSSYSSVGVGGFLDFGAVLTRLEAKVPNVPGVSLRAEVVDQNGWKLQKFEFFNTP
jgi:hypothetical protein